MRQMHAGRKEDRLAAEQKDGRAVIFTSRRYTEVDFVHTQSVLLYSKNRQVRLNFGIRI